MQYDWILFDADDTLFHFDAFLGLKTLFGQYGHEFEQADFNCYQATNLPLWTAYQNGEINAFELQTRRFEGWANRLSVSAKQLNDEFIAIMTRICTLLPGARNLINSLHGKVKLGIITNGFTAMQQARLEHNQLQGIFEPVVISEQVGTAKPDATIFHHALTLMGEPDKSRVLMVGDNLHSDILGGQNAGIKTCWLNHHQAAPAKNITPDHQVFNLAELEVLLHQSGGVTKP
ncbi:pyrimidine 5'-nucleotidase [Motilimonas cestriensis]|uniref:Pyrimidine 5'-nucleotidase n=2 Tax=Motilimonas cestriensis TaxID=2742685 RepID=A0ABS8W749_9GAMM|nr:pyrimidine 5'-nucleotidase [Motilimonas cestriensis]MCE2594811.1 pyrimidine 5'-nucleotidase [Motilimonas cestriensis]